VLLHCGEIKFGLKLNRMHLNDGMMYGGGRSGLRLERKDDLEILLRQRRDWFSATIMDLG